MRFVLHLAKINLLRLGRRLFLLAVIAAAFVMLSFPLAAGVRSMLSRADYSGLTIAVVGQDGEGEALASFAGNLADVSAYCSFVALDEDTAMAELASLYNDEKLYQACCDLWENMTQKRMSL